MKMHYLLRALRSGLLFLLSPVLILLSMAPALALTPVTGFSNPGNLTMDKHIPSSLPSNAPLVVVLHGCTQNGNEYHVNAGWKKLADLYKFALLVPTQTSGNNFRNCFNWFEPGDINRNQGEGKSIINAMDKVIADHNLDSNRVFVSGLSAGGAMTAVMIGTYPERFKGASVVAGVVYGCATSLVSGLTCMNSPGTNPTTLGNYVRNANPGYSGPWPTVQVYHGSSDSTVSINNLTAIVNQWTNVHGTDQTADVTTTIGSTTRKSYKKGADIVVESFEISGMGHGTPIHPGSADDQCGVTGQYYLDVNLCSSYLAAEYWGITDTNKKPVVNSVTLSDAGSSISVTADITDEDGSVTTAVAVVTNVATGSEVDNFSLTSAGGDSFTGSSSTLADGLYTVAVVATDNEGAVSEPKTETVRVGPPPPPSAPELSNIAVSVNGQCATVSGTVIDTNDDLSSVVVSFGGANVTATVTGTTYSAEGCSLPGGSNTATVTATDSGGLQDTDSITFTIDTGVSATLTQHINAGRLSYADSYAYCYLEYGFSAFTLLEKPNGSQCRWEDNDASCVGPVQACSTGAPPPGSCQEFTATNVAHAAAGRATLNYVTLYYSVGGNDYLGLGTATTTLKSNDGASWSLGGC